MRMRRSGRTYHFYTWVMEDWENQPWRYREPSFFSFFFTITIKAVLTIIAHAIILPFIGMAKLFRTFKEVVRSFFTLTFVD